MMITKPLKRIRDNEITGFSDRSKKFIMARLSLAVAQYFRERIKEEKGSRRDNNDNKQQRQKIKLYSLRYNRIRIRIV
jgi:hypothetical protein